MNIDPITILLIVGAVAVVAALAGKKSKGSKCTGDMLAETNAWRAKGATAGGVTYPPVPPVSIDPTLQHVANLFAADLANNKIQAGHIGSDGSTFTDRLNRAGYRWSWAGENTAAGTDGAAATIAAFAASPSHCPTLMSARATRCGLACASADGRAYWVQVMGRPA
jgi:uncharacterized protein YkwD